MREEDTLRELQEDIVIPDIVQKKANQAFAQIKREEKRMMNEQGKRGLVWRKKAVAAAAVVVLAGGVTVVGASMHWSHGLSKRLMISEEQKENMEQDGAAAFTMQSQTHNGVTVTAEQSITDNYFAHISFKIEGYSLPDGAAPDIEEITFYVGDNDEESEGVSMLGASFSEGVHLNQDGESVYEDGTPVDVETENGAPYVQEDGSLEYCMMLSSDEKGYFLNKNIHVELKNIGTVDDNYDFDKTNAAEGTWSFDWNLQGTDKCKEVTFQKEPIGATQAKMLKAEITPISLHVEYEFPRQTHQEIAINEDGEKETFDDITDGPSLTGVKLKDGTVYNYLCNGGSYGYVEEGSDRYEITAGNDRIIDPDQVEYLMFRKEGGKFEKYSEDDYDFIAVK